MTKKLFILMCMLGFVVILSFSGCTTADAANYTLTVTVSNGVTGTPATGSYTYTENDTVNYSYSAQTGYGGLTVTLDGTPVANAGVITMTASHTLAVTADIDIRGLWTGRFYYDGDDCNLEITFSGGVLSGSASGGFEWEGYYGNGDFTLSGNNIEFVMSFGVAEWTCIGTLSDVNHMSGDWTWITPGWEGVGSFTLER
jgi:hypothetical protein